jgi:transcriptional regulator with XRE-family HTH domain
MASPLNSPHQGQVYALVVGQVIANHRERKGWSQSTLAEALGVTQTTISRIERGQSGADAYFLHRVAEVLGLAPEALTAQIGDILARTERAAGGVIAPRPETPWWEMVLMTAGFVGVAALVTFAVASAVEPTSEAPTRTRARPRSPGRPPTDGRGPPSPPPAEGPAPEGFPRVSPRNSSGRSASAPITPGPGEGRRQGRRTTR